MLLYMNVYINTIKIVNWESDKKLSKIKEKKLNSIKSEMEEIKKFIVSSTDLDKSEQNKTYYSNNNEDTLTLTKIVNKEDELDNENKLVEIIKELKDLKKAIEINKNLINQVLLKIK